jgi:[ribosomal protein S5]-alanine N-acetyltransferase
MEIEASKLVLETDRLVLRHLSLEDLDTLAAIQADPQVMRYFTSGPRTKDEVLSELERCIALQDRHGFGLWAAIEKADGRLIGRCGLLPQALQGREEVEIAYLIDRSRWGLGLGTEAAIAIRDHGFTRLGRDRLVSIIHRDNLASRRVAEKVGLHAERLIQFMNHRCWLYAIESKDRSSSIEGSAWRRSS